MRRFLAGALLLVGWAVAAQASTCSHKQGPFQRELARTSKVCSHPLCGHIYATDASVRTDRKAPCSDEQWVRFQSAASAALSAGGVVILGETHDNATHHLLQAAAIEDFALLAPPNVTGIVFEQFREDQQADIDKFIAGSQSGKAVTVADLKQSTGWARSGWPDLYDPVFEKVLAQKRPFYAGDVSRAAIMKVAKGSALSTDESRRLGLDIPLGEKYDVASIKEIEDAHCGALPKEAFGGMAFAQRYRDAHLADVVLGAIQRDGSAILIAGTGHARTDRGVPWYVRQRAPEKQIVSVVFIEVESGKTDPKLYVPRDPDGRPAADFVIFTQPAERGDPCEKMRAK